VLHANSGTKTELNRKFYECKESRVPQSLLRMCFGRNDLNGVASPQQVWSRNCSISAPFCITLDSKIPSHMNLLAVLLLRESIAVEIQASAPHI
jgi:hypothetical protein